MFQDIKVSDDLNAKFFDYLKINSPKTSAQNQTMTNFLGLDFNIYVLQVSFLNIYNQIFFSLII